MGVALDRYKNAEPVYVVDADGNPAPQAGTGAASNQVQGNAANGAPDVGNPVKVGGVGTSGTPAATPNGARTDAWFTLNGAMIVGGGVVNGIDTVSNGALLNLANSAGAGIAVRPLITAGYVYDGTNWQRQRGDTAGNYIAANSFWTEATTGLAANASFVGTLRSNGGTANGTGSRYSFFIAEAFSDVAGGTLFVDKSVDGGTTWRQVGSIALTAATSVSLKVPLSAASYRARVTNGGTVQGAALVTTAFSLN